MDLEYSDIMDFIRDDMAMDVDLNLEPTGSGVGVDLLSGLSARGRLLRDQTRLIEEVTARITEQQRLLESQNPPPEISNTIAVEPGGFVGIGSELPNGEDSGVGLERTIERDRNCKRDSSHLVATALAMDLDVKDGGGGGGDGGRFYDCNICLEMAKEPILTCCGHLFCWACFYQLPYVYSTAKECPVCKGEVIDANITPIYGNANDTHLSETESGLKIPPRPPAHRIESVRQQRVNRRISHIPVAEALRRIRIGIGATAEQPRQQDVDSANAGSDTTSQVLLHSRQFSRILSENALSFSSISSALNNARSLDDEFDAYIHARLLGRTDPQFVPVNGGEFSSSVAVIQTELQTADSTTETNFAFTRTSSSGRSDTSAAIMPLENPETGSSVAGNLSTPHPSPSRGRSGARSVSDAENEVSRETRRRRLR